MPIRTQNVTGEEPKPDTPPPAETTPKRGRRTKAQLIADAVVPADNENVEVKFTATGTKADRNWLVAVELFREDKIEFVAKDLKYAVMKMDKQREGGAAGANPQEEIESRTKRWVELQRLLDNLDVGSEEHNTLVEEANKVRDEIIALGGTDPQSDDGYAEREAAEQDKGTTAEMAAAADTGSESGKKGDANVPPEAEVGDEVVVGSETYRVGHGRVLVQGQIGKPDGEIIRAKKRWQRELGTGKDGPWESKPIESSTATTATANNITVTRETTESTAEPVHVAGVDVGLWKVTMGYKEKIGLPDYSNLEVGPASAQRYVREDGRFIEMEMHGRQVKIPAAVVEGMQEAAQICEYVMRAERSAMINFLEAVKPGSTKPTES